MQQKLQLLRQLLNLLLLRKSEYIYQEALNHIGVDASPDDLVDDVVGCAESVSAILQKHINMPIITGTYTLFDYMNKSTNFARTDIPMQEISSSPLLVWVTGLCAGMSVLWVKMMW